MNIDKKLLICKILRIIFAVVVLIWGIKMWKHFPENIPIHFDAAFKPDERGIKAKYTWQFLFVLAAFLPIRAEDKNSDEEKKKAVILSWVHTVFMCAIFIASTVLIKKNLG